MIVLASASPRRAELLTSLGLCFEIVPSAAEELHDERLPLEELCIRNAELKARDVLSRVPGALVIGADTLVALDGALFGKPRDLDQARMMLRRLSGRTHQVVTGVCLVENGRMDRFADATEVTFRRLTSEDIDEYLKTVPVLDKAGAYGIQERGELLIESIRGSFTNVMGFPTERFAERFARWNATPSRASDKTADP
jgi:septum formation protein